MNANVAAEQFVTSVMLGHSSLHITFPSGHFGDLRGSVPKNESDRFRVKKSFFFQCLLISERVWYPNIKTGARTFLKNICFCYTVGANSF